MKWGPYWIFNKFLPNHLLNNSSLPPLVCKDVLSYAVDPLLFPGSVVVAKSLDVVISHIWVQIPTLLSFWFGGSYLAHQILRFPIYKRGIVGRTLIYGAYRAFSVRRVTWETFYRLHISYCDYDCDMGKVIPYFNTSQCSWTL